MTRLRMDALLRSAGPLPAGAFLLASWSCGSPAGPSPEPTPLALPARPVLLNPVGGVQVSADQPTFTVRNAKDFDAGQAQYGFRVTTATAAREIVTATVPAGRGTTSFTPPTPLPRGMELLWSVTAQAAATSVGSDPARFRSAAVACGTSRDPYAKAVLDWFVPPVCLAKNVYNNPNEILGPPNAGGFGPLNYRGFFSLGEKGYVTADMEDCAVDGPGPDVRVFQAVGSEPVTLYAGGSPNGPFSLVEYRKTCGTTIPGMDKARRYCDFDLALAEVQESRYFRVEDGELFPCAQGGTPSEGADIDAIQILNLKP